MDKVSINKNMHLSEHYTLGEVCKTSHKTKDGNIPSRVAIENLKNICENWLEDLRYSNNVLYEEVGSDGGQVPVSPEAQSVSDRNLSPVRHMKTRRQGVKESKTILLRQILRSL